MLKKAILFLLGFALILLGITFYIDHKVSASAENLLFEKTDSIPFNKVGLLLGTAKYSSHNRINLYYLNRIEAAAELYHAGKVKYILVSGDNSTKYYDEPSTFKKDLIALGIPEDKIILDFAGFRTLDSVVRSKEVFGQESITIISQPFHNERALYLARDFGINAIGYNAEKVGDAYGFKTQLREKLARVKMCLDILFGVEPKFLGERIEIG